jgi:hypothetical protein
MTTERDDAELREHFQQLRQEDERLARELSLHRWAARRRPAAGRRGQLRPRLAVAAALGLALAAGVGVLHWLRPRPAPLTAEAAIARLSSWRAPTDSLLRAPGGELLRGVPRLGESSIGGNVLGGGKDQRLRRQ